MKLSILETGGEHWTGKTKKHPIAAGPPHQVGRPNQTTGPNQDRGPREAKKHISQKSSTKLIPQWPVNSRDVKFELFAEHPP